MNRTRDECQNRHEGLFLGLYENRTQAEYAHYEPHLMAQTKETRLMHFSEPVISDFGKLVNSFCIKLQGAVGVTRYPFADS